MYSVCSTILAQSEYNLICSATLREFFSSNLSVHVEDDSNSQRVLLFVFLYKPGMYIAASSVLFSRSNGQCLICACVCLLNMAVINMFVRLKEDDDDHYIKGTEKQS